MKNLLNYIKIMLIPRDRRIEVLVRERDELKMIFHANSDSFRAVLCAITSASISRDYGSMVAHAPVQWTTLFV